MTPYCCAKSLRSSWSTRPLSSRSLLQGFWEVQSCRIAPEGACRDQAGFYGNPPLAVFPSSSTTGTPGKPGGWPTALMITGSVISNMDLTKTIRGIIGHGILKAIVSLPHQLLAYRIAALMEHWEPAVPSSISQPPSPGLTSAASMFVLTMKKFAWDIPGMKNHRLDSHGPC